MTPQHAQGHGEQNQTMAEFIIKGGKRLKGTIAVRGSKNHATKVFPAALLFKEAILIDNMPLVEDVSRSKELLTCVGGGATAQGRRWVIAGHSIRSTILKKDIAERIRTSILFVGPILGRKKKVLFPHPGGCIIGKRPIDLFLDGWKAMGARITQTPAGFALSAPVLHGIDYTFRVPSHTATEGLMMTAVLARGRTILRNAACEVEIAALADMLIKGGARIKGAGTPTLIIEGRDGNLLARAQGAIIPDRLEAGSFAILATLLGDPITITRCNPNHLDVLLAHLAYVGASIKKGRSWIRVARAPHPRPINIKTKEYPGFVTDYQAPFTVLLTQAKGQSLVFETIFDGRLSHIEELNRMGARITLCDPHRAIVMGPTPLRGRTMESPDLRAGLAFLIAALIAKGESHIGNIYQIDRGHEKIDERLRALGANIIRVNNSNEVEPRKSR